MVGYPDSAGVLQADVAASPLRFQPLEAQDFILLDQVFAMQGGPGQQRKVRRELAGFAAAAFDCTVNWSLSVQSV